MGSRAEIGARRLRELLGEGEGETGAAARTEGPLFRSLAQRLQLLIVDGRVPLGARLPSERELAATLGRSRSTVVGAYDLLRASGHLRSRRGSGTVTALPARRTGAPAVGQHGRAIDFAHAVPPPVPGLDEYVRRALTGLDRALTAPGFDLLGDELLRSRIADHYTARGVPTTAREILVTVGGQHAIGTVARGLVRRGDRVLVESPSYPHAYDAFQAVGARLVPTPVSRDGWDADHLLETIERIRPPLAYLVPDFHNPTGASMPPGLRAELARAAARSGTILVVDETTAQLDIDRGWDDGPVARHATAQGAEAVSIGSLSKSMWGGLRIGWIRARAATVDRLARLRPAFDLGTPRLEQLVAAELLPDLDVLLRVRREGLRAGRERLRSALTGLIPEWDVPHPDGGLSLWVGLGRPLASSLAVLCQTRDLAVSAGPRFTVDGSQERFLRLPFTEPPEELARGAEILAEVWEALGPAGGAHTSGAPTSVV